MLYAEERMKMHLRCVLSEGKGALQAMVQKLIWLVLLVLLLFALLSLGTGFLFYGIAQWFNALWGSSCIGFFIVSFFCFLGVTFLTFLLYRNVIQSTDATESAIERSRV